MIAVATILALALAQTPEELVRQLGHEEASRREEAATALEALGEKAIPALEKGAKSEDPEIRERAAEVLSTIRVALMVGMRLDPDRLASVREAIDDWRDRARGPGPVRGDEDLSKTAYDDLLEFPGGETRPADLADIPYLLGILSHPGPGEGVVEGLPRAQYLQVRALQAIRQFPIADENETHLIAVLRAVLPSGERPTSEADELYWGGLFSEAAQITQPNVREAIRTPVIAALGLLAESKQPYVRILIAIALAQDDADTVPILARLLVDPDPHVRGWATGCLKDRDPTPFRDILPKVVADAPYPRRRYEAAMALAACGEKAAIDALFDLASGSDGSWYEAFSSIQGLLAAPESLTGQKERVLEQWQAWWTEHRATARWDPDQERFVTE